MNAVPRLSCSTSRLFPWSHSFVVAKPRHTVLLFNDRFTGFFTDLPSNNLNVCWSLLYGSTTSIKPANVYQGFIYRPLGNFSRLDNPNATAKRHLRGSSCHYCFYSGKTLKQFLDISVPVWKVDKCFLSISLIRKLGSCQPCLDFRSPH